jgi:hypothetical protein
MEHRHCAKFLKDNVILDPHSHNHTIDVDELHVKATKNLRNIRQSFHIADVCVQYNTMSDELPVMSMLQDRMQLIGKLVCKNRTIVYIETLFVLDNPTKLILIANNWAILQTKCNLSNVFALFEYANLKLSIADVVHVCYEERDI